MNKNQQAVFKMISPTEILNTLTPILSDNRQHRIDTIAKQRLTSIHLVMESPADIHNAIAACRSAEAFGVLNIHIINPEGRAIHAKSISQSAIYWVHVHYYETLDHFLGTLPKNACLSGAIMQGDYSLTMMPIPSPLYLILGNEHRGLSPEALAACHQTYQIPMVGMSESLNLSVSAAISLYETTSRHRQAKPNTIDMTHHELQTLKAQYALRSVKSHYLPGIFPAVFPPR